MTYLSGSEFETKKIAADLAATLVGGEVILLLGQLGSGKTVFAKGLAAALGVRETVTSPTFAIMNLYEADGGLRLCHCDAYRLTGIEDAGDITEYFGASGVISVIEWPQMLGSEFEKIATLSVKIEYFGESLRQITIEKI